MADSTYMYYNHTATRLGVLNLHKIYDFQEMNLANVDVHTVGVRYYLTLTTNKNE